MLRSPLFALGLVGAGVIAAAVWLSGLLPSFDNPFATERVDRTGPTLLRELADLSEYRAATGNFQVLVDVEDDSALPSFLQGERTVFTAVGSVDAIVDFAELNEGAVELSEDGTSATITLPHARYSEATIDTDESRVIDQDRGVFDRLGSVFSDNPDDDAELYRLAEDRIEGAASETELLLRAEDNTTEMLEGLARGFGVDEVRVVFTDNPAT